MIAKKNSKTDKKTDQSRPFMGLRSFEEKNKPQFGGRNEEINLLCRHVEDNNLTIVYGTSGIGKTSLLKAGLMPKLREIFYFPIYIRINFGSSKKPVDQLKGYLYESMNKLDPSVKKIESESVWEYLHDLKLLNGLVTPVLIFDQFEEIFTLGKGKKGIREFVRELANLAQNRIPSAVVSNFAKIGKTVPSRYNILNFRIVISLREDYLARLDELKNYMPAILDSGFRLVQMSISQAMEAAIKPGKGLIDVKVAKEIIKKLPGISQADFDLLNEKGKRRKKLKVEPFLLSLICQRLNEQRIRNQLNIITIDLVKKFKVDDIITSFYNDTLSEFRPDVDLAIQELLLDMDGYRKLDALKEFQDEYSISDEEVNSLIDARIIRKEIRNDLEYLELIHDVLAPVIKKKRNKRKREEREKSEIKNFKRAFAIVVIIAVGIAGYFWYNLREKEKNLWEFASETNTLEGYITYRNRFSEGRYDNKAIDSIDKIFVQEDYKRWQIASEANTSEAYQLFYLDGVSELIDSKKGYGSEKSEFTIYKDSIRMHRDMAKDSLVKIDERAKAEELRHENIWKNAEDEGSMGNISGYLKYIKSDLISKSNYTDAVAKIKELGKTGWLFSGYIKNGKMNTSESNIFMFKYRKNGENIVSTDIPNEGDIVEAISTRRTYRMLQTLNELNGTNNVNWRRNGEAFVLDVIIDGDALFLKIVYEK